VSEQTETGSKKNKKGGVMGLLIGLLAALLFGAGGFYAAYSGMIKAPGSAKKDTAAKKQDKAPLPGIGFVKLDPIVIAVADSPTNQHLRFRASLEVSPSNIEAVSLLKPRVMDTLISYLRAVEPRTIEDPGALAILRAQMLRRVQVVTGKGQVRDLLITEFVLN